VSKAFYDGHVGVEREHALAFGFPSERHLRLAVKLDLLRDGGSIDVLSWEPQQPLAPLGSRWRWQRLDPADASFDTAIAQASERMRSDPACTSLLVGERGPAYVRWRFFERPGRRQAAFALRRAWSRNVVGVAILELVQPTAQWLDWIGSPADMPHAWRGCMAEAQGAAANSLGMWASPAVTQSLAGTGARHIATTPLGIPSRSALTEGELARTRWWLTGGDTDFL
jgi:hypothetical protein